MNNHNKNMQHVQFNGGELSEAVGFAKNYHNWILEKLLDHLGRRIVEVGAGIGTVSERIIYKSPLVEKLLLLEPDLKFSKILEDKFNKNSKVIVNNGILPDFVERYKEENIDTFIYINVMEHIEDDLYELKTVYNLLIPDGKLLIFVPAMRILYSELDKRYGHYRRYELIELRQKTKDAGFKIIDSYYMDVAGILPWLISYRLLKRTTITESAVKIYDKIIIPIMKRVEGFVKPPLGKNILLIAQKII